MWENSTAFWAQRDRWTTSRAFATAGRTGDNNLIGKAQRWAVKSEQYLRASPKVAGWVEFNQTQLMGALKAHIEKLGPALAEAFDDELPLIAAAAFGAWPVRSGFSKSSIQLYYFDRGDDDFGGGIAATAPYVLFIKSQPARRLIGNPMRTVLARLGPRILTEVSRG